MTIPQHTLLFFDASCLIAAAGSPTGGSGFLLSLCQRGLLRGAVSELVLAEAELNVLTKLSPAALSHLGELLETTPLQIARPGAWEEAPWAAAINAKDRHVVAAALAAHSPFLLTLDRALAAEVNQVDLSIQAISPGDFIRDVLPHHTEYPALRKPGSGR